jgi:hypothetical protein
LYNGGAGLPYADIATSTFKQATVASGDVPSTQTNFPSYVDLSRIGITTLDEAQSVRVYADSGKATEWAREIVSATEMHVKVPSLTNTVSIYVDWDGVRPDYAATDTYGRNAVWTDYAGVWHGDDTTDSKAATNNLTLTGSGTYSAGKIGNAFTTSSASGQYWRTGSTPSGLPTGKPNMTYSYWLNWTSVAANNFAVTYGTDSTNQAYFAPGSSGSAPYKHATFWASGVGAVVGADTISTSTWYYITTTYDQTTHTMYIDATSKGTASYTSSNITNNYFNIMKHPALTTNGVYGQCDEVRVKGSVSSADWITTEYNNQSDEAGFWGTWSTVGGSSNTTNFFFLM